MRTWLAALVFLFSLVASPTRASAALRCDDAGTGTLDRGGETFAHRCVSTNVTRAQSAFDDGLTSLYGFNPEEARRAFARAARFDASLAIAWWGIAATYVPNINQSYDSTDARAGRAAIARARGLAARATPVERALVDALAQAFARIGPHDGEADARAYRDAMAVAAHGYPLDDDVQVLAAQAEMNVHPWSYYDDDGTPTPGTRSLVARLRTVLDRRPEHVGAMHFAIHALEQSKRPQDALPAARRLSALHFSPSNEHLTHMPAHAFMRVGEYHAAGEANARAVDSYRRYLAGEHRGHTEYLAHDCLFGIDAFAMSGESARARDLVRACDRADAGLAIIVDLRFGDWRSLATDAGTSGFARGMQLVHMGRIASARAQERALHGSTGVRAFEAAFLRARIARATGDAATEIAALERAVTLQDRFGYAEPPTFWYPVRESLGATLVRAGQYDAAEHTLRATLAHDREDPRALFGLAETLERSGRTSDARDVRERYHRAWRQADVRIDMKDL
ncbi:MAG: tetratricopeptide repeat protein [Vulcanimicrobiaceae bacterium]